MNPSKQSWHNNKQIKLSSSKQSLSQTAITNKNKTYKKHMASLLKSRILKYPNFN